MKEDLKKFMVIDNDVHKFFTIKEFIEKELPTHVDIKDYIEGKLIIRMKQMEAMLKADPALGDMSLELKRQERLAKNAEFLKGRLKQRQNYVTNNKDKQ